MEIESINLIKTLLLVFFAAISGGLVARKLGQPLLVGYIVAGILVANVFPGISDSSVLTVIADSGVTLLLFAIGLEFSLHRFRAVFHKILPAVFLQISAVSIAAAGLGLLSGLPYGVSILIGIIVSLSSTAVISKILTEKGELETLHGEIATAWLIIQDLSVIPIMIFLPVFAWTLSLQADLSGVMYLVSAGIIKTIMVIAGALLAGRYAVPALLNLVAATGSRELSVLVTVCLVFVSAVGTYIAGLSAPLGAFMAGLIISETSQNHTIFSEIRPLRDLFAVVFFTALGMMLSVSVVFRYAREIIAITILAMMLKSAVVYSVSRFGTFHRRTAFTLAILLLPVSEFGFVLANEAYAVGMFSRDYLGIIVTVILLTIICAAPMITNTHLIYQWFWTTLGSRIPRLFASTSNQLPKEGYPIRDHIVLCGYGRVGRYVGRALSMAGVPLLIIDYNHSTVRYLRQKRYTVIYGDPADISILDYAQVDLARVLVVAIPDRHSQQLIIGNALKLNRKIKIFCRTHHEEDLRLLKSLGAHVVVQPEFEAALNITSRVLLDFGITPEVVSGKIARLKIEHGQID